MKTAAGVAGFLVMLGMTSAGLSAGDRVAVRVWPQVAFAPADLSVRAMVEADQNNRSIEIIADSNDFYRSSEIPLDGENAPRLTTCVFKDVPRGAYEVRVILKDSRGEPIAMSRAGVNIVANNP